MLARTAVAMALLLAGNGSAMACELEFAYSTQASMPDLSAGAPDATLPGLAVEIVAAAVAKAGCTAHFVRRPGKRMLAGLRAGQHVGALMLSYSEQRAGGGAFPMIDSKPDANRRLARMSTYLYRPAGSALDWDGQRLLHVDGAIGANSGYAVVAQLQALGVKVEEVASSAQNLEKMQRGRLAGYAMHEYGADPLIKSGRFGAVDKLPIPLSRRDYYLAFSPQFYAAHRDMAERIWDQIAVTREAITDERLPMYAQ